MPKSKKFTPVFFEKEIEQIFLFFKLPPVFVSIAEWFLKFLLFIGILYHFFLIGVFIINKRFEILYNVKMKDVTVPVNLLGEVSISQGLLFLIILVSAAISAWGFFHFWNNRRLGWAIVYYLYLLQVLVYIFTNKFYPTLITFLGLFFLFQARPRFNK